jgi:putative ABC transport system ATP-binding protein
MEPVARVESLWKTYDKGNGAPVVHALRDVSFDIPRGQYVAIMGPSGSGKSTLMNIIGCLDRPSKGHYYVDGDDIANMTDNVLSEFRGKRLGFVFQAFNLIPQLTVQQNVEVPLFYQGIPPKERRERAMASIAKVELAERGHHRPRELSGGQQQRVAIARALVNRPSILLADEPTGNLDSKTGTAILELFDELHANGLTIVMVTHDENVAHRCERVIRLRDGQIDTDILNPVKVKPQPTESSTA